MLKNLMNKKKGKGFTLIELIIVIAIIAILAALIIPKMGSIKESANVKADISNAKNIHSAAVVFDEENPSSTLTTSYQAISDILDKTGGSTKLSDSLQSVPTGKAKDYKGKNFKAKKDANGDIHIAVEKTAASGGAAAADTEVYPKGEDPYVNN
jgi:type IV pilus assembly protein PilA